MILRQYQQQAVDSTLCAFSSGEESVIIVLPTGTGKTIVFGHIIDLWTKKTNRRALVLAHREELIFQAQEKVGIITGEKPDIEMAEYRANHSLYDQANVIVSTIQTQSHRKEQFDPYSFGLVVIDESHHAPAKSYKKVIAHYQQNPNCKILGVTATPDRADKLALGKVFKHVAYTYRINDAIHDGWLVPINQRCITVQGLD